jgi:hypothetical protein
MLDAMTTSISGRYATHVDPSISSVTNWCFVYQLLMPDERISGTSE